MGKWDKSCDFHNLPASDIERARENMVQGGALAAEAGFDGMDFKLCHGHLTHRLLMNTNARTDEWGGATLQERSRFFTSALRDMRKLLKTRGNDDFILGAIIAPHINLSAGSRVYIWKRLGKAP